MTPRIIVVGGGITGLAAGWFLRQRGADVVVLEAGDRLGGKLHTGTFAGHKVELGADAFLARHPDAQRLAHRVGLGDDLVHPATGRVWLWTRGRLRPLPQGTVLGAPADPVALARSGVLPPMALLRAAAEPVVAHRHVAGDRAIADVVGERFGRAVVDHLVEPLLGGVYAGRADRLSVQATAPMLAEADRARSMIAGLRRYRAGQVGSSDRPVFATLRSGLSTLPETLAAGLGDAVRTGAAAEAVEPDGDGWQVTTADGTTHHADGLVMATPAFVTAELLADTAREPAAEIAGIEYASVAVVTLAYDRAADAELPEGSGMLVPRVEGRLTKASTWVSRKWPHHADADHLLIRASVGRIDDQRWRDLDDDELVARVDAELRWATGISRPAVDALVTPWERSLPQYTVGHRQRIDRIRMQLPAKLRVAGAAYDGIGISPCVASADAAAAGVLHDLESRPRG